MPVTPAGIAYDRSSCRSTVAALLLHAGVADRRMWEPQWRALSAEWDLLRLDLRGFGESDTPSTGTWSHASDVLATMDQEGVELAHLVGSSLGAGVAVEVALAAPSRVASLLLCPPGGVLLRAQTDDLAVFITEETAALEAGDLDAAVEANLRTWVVGPGRDEADLDQAMLAEVRSMQRRAFQAAEAVVDAQPSTMTLPAVERLSEIAAPTVILVGRWDLETTRDAVEHAHATIRRSQRMDWSDAAHLPSLEHPDRFSDLLRRWLATQTT
jgi:3-oxoadipate enol-lactonase